MNPTETVELSASPVAADGRLYFASEEGVVYVVAEGFEYELLGKNELGEECMATPAIAQGVLYYRTRGHLTALGAPTGITKGPDGAMWFTRTVDDDIVRVLLVLRDDPRLSFSQLSDLCGVDYPDRPERFAPCVNGVADPQVEVDPILGTSA